MSEAMTDTDLRRLAERLRNGPNPSVHEYEFAHKGIGEEAAQAIIALLDRVETLKWVNLEALKMAETLPKALSRADKLEGLLREALGFVLYSPSAQRRPAHPHLRRAGGEEQMTDGGYTMTEAWNLQLQAEISRLRAELAEAQLVIFAMREALIVALQNIRIGHTDYYWKEALAARNKANEALRRTPASLAGMVLVKRERMTKLADLLDHHWDMWVKDGKRTGPSVSKAIADEIRAMIGDDNG